MTIRTPTERLLELAAPMKRLVEQGTVPTFPTALLDIVPSDSFRRLNLEMNAYRAAHHRKEGVPSEIATFGAYIPVTYELYAELCQPNPGTIAAHAVFQNATGHINRNEHINLLGVTLKKGSSGMYCRAYLVVHLPTWPISSNTDLVFPWSK